jgi:hypothetical protein
MVKQFIFIMFLLLVHKFECSRLRTNTKTGVSKIALRKVAPAHIHAINFVGEIQDTINDYSECNYTINLVKIHDDKFDGKKDPQKKAKNIPLKNYKNTQVLCY